MATNCCLFCGSEMIDPDHLAHCDGRQGRIEALVKLPTFDPYEHARTSDPDTSTAAALMVDATEVQRRVYLIFREHPDGLTDEALVGLYAKQYPVARSLESRSSPRKRRSDLARAGILVDSGNRRLLTSGRYGVVWTLVAFRASVAS